MCRIFEQLQPIRQQVARSYATLRAAHETMQGVHHESVFGEFLTQRKDCVLLARQDD